MSDKNRPPHINCANCGHCIHFPALTEYVLCSDCTSVNAVHRLKGQYLVTLKSEKEAIELIEKEKVSMELFYEDPKTIAERRKQKARMDLFKRIGAVITFDSDEKNPQKNSENGEQKLLG